MLRLVLVLLCRALVSTKSGGINNILMATPFPIDRRGIASDVARTFHFVHGLHDRRREVQKNLGRVSKSCARIEVILHSPNKAMAYARQVQG